MIVLPQSHLVLILFGSRNTTACCFFGLFGLFFNKMPPYAVVLPFVRRHGKYFQYLILAQESCVYESNPG
jgi:hypothetical protein